MGLLHYIIASSEASNLATFRWDFYGFRAEDAKNLDDIYVNTRSQGFGDEVKCRIMLGTFSLSSGYYDAYYKKAGQVRTSLFKTSKKSLRITTHPLWTNSSSASL